MYKPGHRSGETRSCVVCDTEFYVTKYQMSYSVRKYCSRACYWKNKHDEPWNKGKTAKQDGRILSGERTYQWKGTGASYTSKHKSVAKNMGKPESCERCGTTNAKKYEWSNIDHKYSRNPKDYTGLCTSCHRLFDETWLKRDRDERGRFA